MAVTAVGVCSPLGVDADETWRHLLAGETHGFRLAHWPDGGDPGWPDVAGFRAAAVDDTALARITGPGGASVTRASRLTLAAAVDAWPGGLPRGLDRDRVGVVFGASKPDLAALAAAGLAAWPAAPASLLAAEFGLAGPCSAPAAACASGVVACLRGADLIAEGVCDAVLVGAVDASIHPAVLASFARLGVTSRERAGRPAGVRPLDVTRDGFLVGEGAAVLVLEAESSACARSAEPLAWLLGGASLSGAGDLVRLDRSAGTLTRVLSAAVSDAGLTPGLIDLVGLHATATVDNDRVESEACRSVFGRTPPVCAQKGALGHLLGASSAVESALLVRALAAGRVPPTAGTGRPDPELGLTIASTRGNPPAERVLKISAGFGGVFAAAVWGRGGQER
ncbi:MAG: beta-ketoacyl synthase N-terminal-like domain-containing protein [Planctomycetota bacterium]